MPRPRKFVGSGRPGGYFVPLDRPLNCAADVACATCPFSAGNDRQLAKLFVEMLPKQMPGYSIEKIIQPVMRIVSRVAPRLLTKLVRWTARKQVETGYPFICHSSVYRIEVGQETELHPQSNWRVCRGSVPLAEKLAPPVYYPPSSIFDKK